MVTQDHMQSLAPSRWKGTRWKEKILLKLKASLASAEVSAGVVAKAEQQFTKLHAAGPLATEFT